MTTARPAVFLDRDGTLIEDTGYVKDPQLVRILPTVAEALLLFEKAGFERVVISNQSGIARGILTDYDMAEITRTVDLLLHKDGASIDAVYYCPHLNDGCACRKPLPGLIRRAAAERNLDLARSVMIGDRGSDIEAGHAAGMPGIFVTTGPLEYHGPPPDLTVDSLLVAVPWVLARAK